jgi:hypothetical protein
MPDRDACANPRQTAGTATNRDRPAPDRRVKGYVEPVEFSEGGRFGKPRDQWHTDIGQALGQNPRKPAKSYQAAGPA